MKTARGRRVSSRMGAEACPGSTRPVKVRLVAARGQLHKYVLLVLPLHNRYLPFARGFSEVGPENSLISGPLLPSTCTYHVTHWTNQTGRFPSVTGRRL